MKTPVIYILVCIAALSSCGVAYRSTAINTPLLAEKHEGAITAANNNLQAAYAVTNNIGVMANGYFESKSVPIDAAVSGGKGYLGELGVGYFRKLYSKPDIVVEMYGGAGYGRLNLINNYSDSAHFFSIVPQQLDANVMRVFLQPSIGYKSGRFEVSTGLRYSGVSYMNVKTVNYTMDQLLVSKQARLSETMFNFIEPHVTLRVGIRNVKIQFQYIYCIKVTNVPIKYNDDKFYVGIFIKLHTGKHFAPLKNQSM